MSSKRKVDYGAIAAKQVQRDTVAAAKTPDRFERAQAALSGPATLLELDEIVPRQESTRDTDPGHIRALAESIAALGLIEPVVVDAGKRLLAGGHRVDALKLLRVERPELFQRLFAEGVPVRTMDFDAEASQARALEVEIAENEHRRDYTGQQVKQLATRLRAAGYKDSRGRPKEGEKALGPALEVVVGKSMKTIRKLLAEDDGPSEPRVQPSPLARLHQLLQRQREHVPAPLHGHLDALLKGLEAELDAMGQG